MPPGRYNWCTEKQTLTINKLYSFITIQWINKLHQQSWGGKAETAATNNSSHHSLVVSHHFTPWFMGLRRLSQQQLTHDSCDIVAWMIPGCPQTIYCWCLMHYWRSVLETKTVTAINDSSKTDLDHWGSLLLCGSTCGSTFWEVHFSGLWETVVGTLNNKVWGIIL